MDASDRERGKQIMRSRAAVFEDTWITQILSAVMRHRLIVVGVTALMVTCAILAVFFLPRQYTADALILVDESESQLVGMTTTSSVDTEVEILNSSSVTLGAVQRLGLWNDSEFGIESGILSRLTRYFFRSDRAPESINSLDQLPSTARSELVKNVSDKLRIFQRGLTSTITVRATSSDPAKATRLANAIAGSYFELQAAARARSATRAADFLRMRVNELADEIRLDNGRLDQFLATHGGNLSLEPNSSRGSTEGAQGMLRRHVEDGTRVHSSLNQVPLDRSDVTTDLLARENEGTAESKKGASEQLQSSDGGTDGVPPKYVGGQFGDAFAESLPKSVATDYYRLQRNAETNRKLYDSYVARLSDVQQKIGLALPSSRLVAPAITPHEPSFPPTALILFLGITLGLGTGICLALFREYLRGGFSFPQQLQEVDMAVVKKVGRSGS
jgi:polysaccharide biosynthesis transport protein